MTPWKQAAMAGLLAFGLATAGGCSHSAKSANTTGDGINVDTSTTNTTVNEKTNPAAPQPIGPEQPVNKAKTNEANGGGQ